MLKNFVGWIRRFSRGWEPVCTHDDREVCEEILGHCLEPSGNLPFAGERVVLPAGMCPTDADAPASDLCGGTSGS
jgi:hypothetical protein